MQTNVVTLKDIIKIIKEKDIVSFSAKWKPSLAWMADGDGWAPIHFAAAYGNPEIIERILEKDQQKWIENRTDDHGFTPLLLAAKYKNYEALKTLLSFGADSKAVTFEGEGFVDFILQGNSELESQLKAKCNSQIYVEWDGNKVYLVRDEIGHKGTKITLV